jgi:hypothetical protein
MFMKLLSKIAIVFVLVMTSKMALAIPMDYSFDVDFFCCRTGVTGTSAPVNVKLDGFIGSGLETFTPQAGNLLAFTFTFAGVSYDIFVDGFYPQSPRITMLDGELVELRYSTPYNSVTQKPIVIFNLLIAPLFGIDLNGVEIRIPDGLPSPAGAGRINRDSWAVADIAVPAPGTLALFGFGLAGLGISRRKRGTRG